MAWIEFVWGVRKVNNRFEAYCTGLNDMPVVEQHYGWFTDREEAEKLASAMNPDSADVEAYAKYLFMLDSEIFHGEQDILTYGVQEGYALSAEENAGIDRQLLAMEVKCLIRFDRRITRDPRGV